VKAELRIEVDVADDEEAELALNVCLLALEDEAAIADGRIRDATAFELAPPVAEGSRDLRGGA
jgi:hypothetical protein